MDRFNLRVIGRDHANILVRLEGQDSPVVTGHRLEQVCDFAQDLVVPRSRVGELDGDVDGSAEGPRSSGALVCQERPGGDPDQVDGRVCHQAQLRQPRSQIAPQ
jgi:hypothetical protein